MIRDDFIGECLPAYGRALAARYHDEWLSEIASRSVPGYSALAEAVLANDRGDFLAAFAKATEGEKLLLRSHSRAGVLRTRFEQIYALQRRGQGSACIAGAEGLRRDLGARGYPWLRIQAELELSACRNMIGDSGSAMASALRADELAARTGLASLRLRAAAFVTGAYADLGETGLMWTMSLPVIRTFWESPYRAVRGHAFLANLAVAAEERRNLFAAYVFEREATEMLADDPNIPLRALSKSRVGSAAGAAGETEQSRLAYLEAANLFKQLSDKAPVEEFRIEAELMESSALLNRGWAREADTILQRLGGRHPKMPTVGLQIRFKSLSGVARGRMGDKAASEKSFAEALDEAQRLASSMKTPWERRAAMATASEAWRGLLEAQLNNSGNWEKTFETVEGYRAIPTRAKQAANERPEHSIVYAMIGTRVAAWVISGAQTHGQWLPASFEDIQRWVSTFLRQCGDPNSRDEAWMNTGRHLYNALIAPLEPWLGAGGTIAVEADDFMKILPFEALVDLNGRVLGDRFAFVERDSLTNENRRATGYMPLTAGDTAVVISNPELRGAMLRDHPPLPGAKEEGAFVSKIFPRSILLEGAEATQRNLERERPRARLLHFAGHASLTGRGAAVLLAAGPEGEADSLDPRTVQSGDWSHCELVVLAACSTAVGDDPVSGPPALAQAFLDAGARRVVASRWAVDSKSTTVFMKTFYGVLAGGVPAAQALRRASAQMRSSHAHPFHWAAFGIHGVE